MHLPHPIHISGFDSATIPDEVISFALKNLLALPAAPFAWEIESCIFFGHCAHPHKNIPSVAKSKGRNLT